MTHKAYIQSIDGMPSSDWMLSAYIGFKEKGTKVILFEDIEEVPTSPFNIVVAWIEDTLKYFKKMGIPEMKSLNVPSELLRFTGRSVEFMTMEEFMKDLREPIFVKPAGVAKAFPSGILRKASSKRFTLSDVDLSVPVMVSEVIDIVSEYRGYVIKGDLKAIKHYQGDIRIFPNMQVVDEAISAYTSATDGYTIDFGITDKGQTIFIECNDGWSIGNYGLDPRIYSNLLAARWIQIMSSQRK